MSPINVAKTIGAPGSLGFLAISCIIGLLLMHVWPKRASVGRVWLLGTLFVYIGLAFPVVAHSITGGLPPVASTNIATVKQLDALIVLGGDNEDGRVVEALDVWRALKPNVVVLLGDALAGRIRDAGVPAARILENDEPATTRAQMEWLKAELQARPVHAAAIVASRLQMPRVVELARTYELPLVFLVSPLDHDPATSGVQSLIPSYEALELSRDALYEHAALGYYRSRGWIQVQP